MIFLGQQAPNRRKDGLGTQKVTTVCVCFCCLRRSLFFCDAICTAPRKLCIVCTCKPPVNDRCVEALITIPFELPTLLFFQGLKLYAKENKSVMDILWLGDCVKPNCSCIWLVTVNGRALADPRRRQEAANWAESGPCYTDIDESRHV